MSRSDQGSALILAVGLTMVLAAIGMGAISLSNTEGAVAQNYRAGYETLEAADAAIARAIVDLAAFPQWTQVPGGALTSSFTDGASAPRVPSHGTLDLVKL